MYTYECKALYLLVKTRTTKSAVKERANLASFKCVHSSEYNRTFVLENKDHIYKKWTQMFVLSLKGTLPPNVTVLCMSRGLRGNKMTTQTSLHGFSYENSSPIKMILDNKARQECNRRGFCGANVKCV